MRRARLAARSSLRSDAPARAAIVSAAKAAAASRARRRGSVLTEHLPRVQAIVGIQRSLDGAHDVDGDPVLHVQILHLAHADAVLAGAGSAKAQGAHHQSLVETMRLV